jgi:hypothetical protein
MVRSNFSERHCSSVSCGVPELATYAATPGEALETRTRYVDSVISNVPEVPADRI